MIFKPFIREQPWTARVIIRHVTYSDLRALEWEGEYQHFRKVYAQAYERFMSGLSILWAAELPGAGLIGQVFIQLNCDRPELANGHDRAYLYSFRIRPNYRGAGLGSRMLQTVENDLSSRRFRYVTLNVARENERAQQLYLRCGYQIIAPEPGIWSYPDDQGVWHSVEEPAWRMEKEIA
jgi:ribosomal protein S18 acetylase RimI-like enzyme